MKTKWFLIGVLAIGPVLALAVSGGLGLAQAPTSQGNVAPQAAQGTGFTYQGHLTQGEEPVDNTCDFQFGLWDANSGGNQVGITQTVSSVDVDKGYFSVELNGSGEFGGNAFTGDARYLVIVVQCPDDSSPVSMGRVALTAAPYALYALEAPWSGLTSVPAAGGDVGGTYPDLTVTGLQGQPVASIAPTSDQMLRWSGSAWEPATRNLPPVAVLQADPSVLYLGETTTGTVTLSLTLSYDPEGSALTYAFDPTGQALGTSDFGSNPTMTTVYSTTGDHMAAGWVRDTDGAFSIARTLVSVYRFGSTTVDSAGNVGRWTSLAVVEGRPAIAHFDDTPDDLKYVRAADASGSSWGIPVTVDSTDSVGRDASLVVVDGRPAIAYFDATNDELKYVRADDATGASWGTPVTVDSAGEVPLYSTRSVALAVVEGRPAIAYYDHANARLRYVRAVDVAGSSWGTPVTVASGGLRDWVSLAMVEGRPAISYHDGRLMYVRADDAVGSSWGIPVTVDDTGDVGKYATMAIVDGRPAIAHKDETHTGDLKYVRAVDATGSSWGTPVTVDSAGNVGNWLSMAVVNGRPAIAYDDLTTVNYNLKYAYANDATGASWGTPATVESAGHVGHWASLAMVDGRPAIAHRDGGNQALLFTIPRQD